MLKVKRAIGLEDANSSIKLVSRGIQLCYPNTMIEISPDEVETQIRQRNKDANKYRGIAGFGGRNYIVGASEGTGSGGRSKNRYKTGEYKREVAAAIAQVVENPNEQVYIVTGVPAVEAKVDSIKESISKNLKGHYDLMWNGERKIFDVVSVEVFSQPLGTLWNQLFELNGAKKMTSEQKKHDFLIFDIGWGTTDLQSINVKTGLNKPDTIDYAMSDYVDNVLIGIEQQYPESYIRETYESYSLDEEIRDSDILQLPSGNYKIKNIKRMAQEHMATTLYKRLLVKGYNFARFGKIYLTGGGSIILKNSLVKAFGDFGNRLELVDDPQLANAIGFYIMCCQKHRI